MIKNIIILLTNIISNLLFIKVDFYKHKFIYRIYLFIISLQELKNIITLKNSPYFCLIAGLFAQSNIVR